MLAYRCVRPSLRVGDFNTVNASRLGGVDVFLMCFSMEKANDHGYSLENTANGWHRMLLDGDHLEDAKIILVGTKKDLPASPNIHDTAEKMKGKIGAEVYVQTSAKQPISEGGVPELFAEACKAVGLNVSVKALCATISTSAGPAPEPEPA